MRKLLAIALLVCSCSNTAEQAVERLRFVHVKDSDLCFAITGTRSDEGGVAMVRQNPE